MAGLLLSAPAPSPSQVYLELSDFEPLKELVPALLKEYELVHGAAAAAAGAAGASSAGVAALLEEDAAASMPDGDTRK